MKPTIPKGTRDFSPAEMVRREYIFDTIREVFRLYGYQPLETPAMENLTTLLGKYGEEGDRLLFRILNSGDFYSAVKDQDLADLDSGKVSSMITEKGLRYDLTVPFARYVVQHRDEITFPFKRYQIQPVWRADRPQRGRYREFFQCDVDVIGSYSLLNEYELIKITDDVFDALKIPVIIKINNRKVLSGFAEVIGEIERISDITVSIDKIEKIGISQVNEELRARGLGDEAIRKLQPVFGLTGTNENKLVNLREILSGSTTGNEGINELQTLFSYLAGSRTTSEVQLDLTLARGLDYYTGAIIEVKARDVNIGSICGGGRYDNLTGVFGLDGVPGVGVSFGADRIFDVMSQLALFGEISDYATKVLIVNFGEDETIYALKIREMLKNIKIRAELYPDPVKLKKQMSYADSRGIPYTILAGDEEVRNNLVSVKIMSTGEQIRMTKEEMLSFFRAELIT